MISIESNFTGPSGSHCTQWADDKHEVQQATSRDSCQDFPSLKPHYKKYLVSSLLWREAETNNLTDLFYLSPTVKLSLSLPLSLSLSLSLSLFLFLSLSLYIYIYSLIISLFLIIFPVSLGWLLSLILFLLSISVFSSLLFSQTQLFILFPVFFLCSFLFFLYLSFSFCSPQFMFFSSFSLPFLYFSLLFLSAAFLLIIQMYHYCFLLPCRNVRLQYSIGFVDELTLFPIFSREGTRLYTKGETHFDPTIYNLTSRQWVQTEKA